MRKSLSLALAVVMLLSAMIFTIPASAATITESAGTEGEKVEAPYFESAPTIDGIVSEAEWGEASVRVEAFYAASKDDSEPSSRFIFWRTGSFDDYTAWNYDLWLRWDVNYFYIAVKVKDPDKHMNKNGAGNSWNGDAVQTRIDWNGRKPASGGAKPWTNDSVPDLLFAYTQIAGGFTEAWDNTVNVNRGMTESSRNPLGVTKAVVAPAGSSYSADTQAGYTTYEIALPWAYIIPAATRNEFTTLTRTQFKSGPSYRGGNPQGGIGRSLGMSLTVLDGGLTESGKWDAFLAWGSGICGEHQNYGEITTGSNAVVLTDTGVTPQAGYATQDPTSLIEASFTTNNVDPVGVYYDYLKGDTYKEFKLSYDELSVLKYDDAGDRTIWGSKNYNGSITDIGGEHGNVLDFRDITLGQNYLSSEDGEVKFEVPPSYTFEFDICYTDTQIAGDGADKYGSALYNWFGGASMVSYRCGYFFNDKAFELVDDIGADGTNPNIIAKYDYDLKKNVWYKWRFQIDNESCNVRLWIDDTTTEADNADNPWGTMIFNVKNRYFFYSSEDALNPDKGVLLIFRQMNVQTMYDNIKVYNFASNTTIGAPVENTGSAGGSTTVTTEVVSKGEVTVSGTKEDGKWLVPFTLSEKDAKYLANAKSLSFNFTIDPAKGEFDSIKGLDEGAYKVEKGEDGKIVITVTDISAIKSLDASQPLFYIVLKALDDNAVLSDIVKSEVIDYEFEYVIVSTGDATVYVVIAAVVAVIGCAAVVVIRKRKIEE